MHHIPSFSDPAFTYDLERIAKSLVGKSPKTIEAFCKATKKAGTLADDRDCWIFLVYSHDHSDKPDKLVGRYFSRVHKQMSNYKGRELRKKIKQEEKILKKDSKEIKKKEKRERKKEERKKKKKIKC